MYAIGITDYDFIKVVRSDTLYDGLKIWSEVRDVEYGANLAESTVFVDLEVAEKILQEIQSNVEEIQFSNNDVIGEVIDKESFDKVAYSRELKIYELVPTLVERRM